MSQTSIENGHSNSSRSPLDPAIAIYYEHPDWFRPLFHELDARRANWRKMEAHDHSYNPAGQPDFALLFNRMSPSAWQRGLAHTVFYTLNYLAYLEESGVRVVNGSRAFTHETSKALQLGVLESLALAYPKALVIHHPSQALAAAEAIGFPVVAKPNIGGSGAGVQRFSSPGELRDAIAENRLYFGIDSVGLIQQAFTPRDNIITRVEVLGGQYLYAIRIHLTGDDGFNLCPGDICQSTKGEELTRLACPVDAPKSGLKVEGYEPPREVVDDVERIMEVCGIEVGGIEYVTDDRTGSRLYYDINALSNFVADPQRVIGFNPYSRLADFLVAEARRHQPRRPLVAEGAAR
jgi:hypothetical protein